LKAGGYASPSAALITRAGDEWVEEAKNDIFIQKKRLTILQKQAVRMLVKGQFRYENPTDFERYDHMKLMYGDKTTGTAQAGTVGNITLANVANGDLQGEEIVITGGTGKGSFSQIYSYSDTTKVASVAPNFTTAPDSTSTYMIIDSYWDLKKGPIYRSTYRKNLTFMERPTIFYPVGDEDSFEFQLNAVPDQNYAVHMFYFANIMKLDLTGTVLSTIYQRWRNLFTLKVQYKAYENQRRYPEARVHEAQYIAKLREFMVREDYDMNQEDLQIRVSELP